MSKPFHSDLEVPDACPADLILPDDARTRELAVPSAAGHVSPVELSWILFEGDAAYAGLHILKENPLINRELQKVHEVHRAYKTAIT